MKRLHSARMRTITTAYSSWTAACCAILLASGCAPKTTAKSPAGHDEAPPPHLRAPVDLGPTAHRDHVAPLPDPRATGEVSLGGMLAYADKHSPVLAVARSTRSRVEAARVAASPLFPANPQVTVAAGPRFAGAGTGLDVEVALMQQIRLSGERGARLDAADRLGDLTDAEIEQIRWTVHTDVHAEFHRALVEQERVRLAESVVKFQREVLRVVERQISAGETAPLLLRLAQAEVAQAKQVLVAAKQRVVASRIRLAQLAGWPTASPPLPGGKVDVPRDPPTLERLLAVARKRLPSLRAGTARIREAEARVIAADRATWPGPTVGVQYAHEGATPSDGAGNIVMGVVSVPIPSSQTNQAERATARADAIVARAQLSATRRLLTGQIAEARSEVVAAAQRTREYGEEILPRIEENLTLLRRSFELGEIDILALSTGRERFLRIQSDALAAQLDYFVALANLERVVGVDLWRDDHQDKETR